MMKKFKFVHFVLLLAVITTIPLLYSCLDSDEPTRFTVGTVKVIEGNDYYFLLDDNKTMFPGDTTRANRFSIFEGKRAAIYFTLLDEAASGYDYNIKIERVEEILTKDIFTMTEATVDSIGDDKMDLNGAWIANGFVTFEFGYYGTGNVNKKHMINLVRNAITDENEEEDYVYLEFRQNAYDDQPLNWGLGIASFRLDDLTEEELSGKGLMIRVNTVSQGEKFYKIEFKKDNSVSASAQKAIASNPVTFR